ncbi:DeoR/GlpR family DNA-binding transcription regulator [Cryobacterium sp. TMS1-20-1]|uniref:DeoR/GlpR family DNA-binding transcription regulator n=1 Tax=Cryobacterium sp. TMS1-20-1 TaxID=1259223 RepID=UPI001F542F48|nr:DeoR/GlpR family DNA-binding transcription regulator [Cryobacterium sp. TMS1-20-1]
MNRAERLAAVLDLLTDSGQIEVDDIITKLGVSAATARRDLDTLAEQQLLTRTRGGAIGQSVAYDLPARYKQERHAPEKLQIARAASALVTRGDVVGLCGGTTSTAIVGVLSARADIAQASPHAHLTVVTNAINIAAQLAMRPQIKTVVTDGVVHARSYELVGAYAESVLTQVRLDLAFIGVNDIDPVVGATVNDERVRPKGRREGCIDRQERGPGREPQHRIGLRLDQPANFRGHQLPRGLRAPGHDDLSHGHASK